MLQGITTSQSTYAKNYQFIQQQNKQFTTIDFSNFKKVKPNVPGPYALTTQDNAKKIEVNHQWTERMERIKEVAKRCGFENVIDDLQLETLEKGLCSDSKKERSDAMLKYSCIQISKKKIRYMSPDKKYVITVTRDDNGKYYTNVLKRF